MVTGINNTLNNNTLSDEPLILGIDGGGTKCKAVLMTPDNIILGQGVSGPGNPVYGLEQAKHSIYSSALMALDEAGLDSKALSSIVLGVGLAGVNLEQHYHAVCAWQHPFKQLFLTTDLLIASLGAHDGGDGAVIVTGTGSCGFSYVDQKTTILGAHGFPQGDKGSGAWFGLKAVEQALLMLDGLGQSTLLASLVLQQLKVEDQQGLTARVAGKPASFFAQFAHCVFAAASRADATAISIVEQGADYINAMADALMATGPARMSLIGGVGPSLFPWLKSSLQNTLCEPLSPPEVGAVYFARQNLARGLAG